MSKTFLHTLAGVWLTGVFLSATAAPTDNLRADYRNAVHKYTNTVQVSKVPVQLGVGSGYYFTTNHPITYIYRGDPNSVWEDEDIGQTYGDMLSHLKSWYPTPVLRSSIGVPIAGEVANVSLGEELTPPADWDGEAPEIKAGTGGQVEWIDYAKKAITSQAGPIEITWGLAGGGERKQTYVVGSAPNKRPVRLYWTHERPQYNTDTSYKTLQNAGPTVSFGSNYKVTIYPTSTIGELTANSNYYKDDGKGWVHMNGNELQAFEGSYGTFLLVYSRLDEATNVRNMLAYEIVEVLEPKQTQLNVKIGDQLKPQTRDFSTEELFPKVTRGLSDDANRDEIYVYQHSLGAQKDYLWAIRDSSENPWKIEVFWRAKEELDVVWPFEVDIYAASWDHEGSQPYVRDTETAEGGEAKMDPVVYYPSGVTIEVMDWQVVDKGNGTFKQQAHMIVGDGIFYSNWADENTFALLKYTSGDSVWFQSVRSIPAKNEDLRASLGLDLMGACTNLAWRTGSEDPEETPVLPMMTDVALAKEVRAPFAGKDGFFYPGWIKTDHVAPTSAYPVKNPYNVNLYSYPDSYKEPDELRSFIYAVNLGELEVWWSLPSSLMGTPRANGGSPDALSAKIYFPAIPIVYTMRTPEEMAYAFGEVEETPQIVIASGKGSAGYSLNDLPGGMEGPLNGLTYTPMMHTGAPVSATGVVAKLSGLVGNDAGAVSNFTFEARVSRLNNFAAGEKNLTSFYSADIEGNVSATPYLTIGIDDAGNLYVNHADKTGFGNKALPEALDEFGPKPLWVSRGMQAGTIHVAVVARENGNWSYYVNGNFVTNFTMGPVGVNVTTDTANLFEPGVASFSGGIHYVRLWSEARTPQEIDENRYLQCPASTRLVYQFFGPAQEFDNNGDEEKLYGVPKDGYLSDSSGHDVRGYLGFGAEYEGEDTAYWMRAGLQESYGGFRLPHEGRTFPSDATIYRQNDPELDGYNPNEEHAIMLGGIAYALRCDLNRMENSSNPNHRFTSLPYVLVQYTDADTHLPKMCALRVVPESDIYRFHTYKTAGSMIQSPSPLNRFQPANLQKFMSGPLYGTTDKCFVDRKGYYWAHQAGDDGGATNYVFELSYPNQDVFDFVDGGTHAAGEATPWMANYSERDDWYIWTTTEWGQEYWLGDLSEGAHPFPARPTSDPVGTAIDYTYIVNWPENVPKLYVNDTLHNAKQGLPAVRGQLSVKIAYQQSEATNNVESAYLIDPETIQCGSLEKIPDDIRNYRDPKTSKRKFTDLPPFLRDRFQWNPNAIYDKTKNDTRELELAGQFIQDGSYQFAYLNVMDLRSKSVMLDSDLVPGADAAEWMACIESVPTDPIILKDDSTPFTEIALATTGKGAGYVTLVFNDSTNLSMVAKSDVITMAVIRIVPELYNGFLHVIQSDNPLDKQINMKYTSDFGGRPERWQFEWQYCEPVNGTYQDVKDGTWLELGSVCGKPTTPKLDWITVGDAGVFGLSDHYIRCRYRSLDPGYVTSTNWSEWCTPKLAEGWIKRVLKAINPFDQKIRDFLNNKVDTSLSMIQQAGTPYQGDIPLNLEALSENGLIAIYETVLNQAKKLSIDDNVVSTDSLALALQMAAGRIAELYMVLGNEAYADALNPTVDLGSGSGVDDTAESSIFPFMNQCENLLDEELALLRGRDMSEKYATSWKGNIEPWEYPFYNRLAWNFTTDIMGGQVAYVENYGIRDVCGASDAADPTAKDGVINVYDAKKLYPQGHGDAWGHYLSGVKGYYALLRHPNFGWKPQIEGVLAGQTEITMGLLHEKRFAQVAEMKAKTGEKIVADTYRQNYVAGESDAWLDAEDDETWTDAAGKEIPRAWGTDEWATRAHLGAYYDWAVVNALLPARNANEGLIKMLDRESTKELSSIAASARRIQSTADTADAGLNPLGLSDSAIPFDISPREIDAGKTHFEQVYERAVKATQVAKAVFDRAKSCANKLRDQNASSDYENMVDDEEAAIERELIGIYGYPYADDIGPGKTYEQGYDGPDIYHYYYVETYDLDNSGGINGTYRGVSSGDGSYGRYIDVTVDDYRLITTNMTGTYQAEIDESLADNGFLGNIIVGAVSWYQQTLAEVGSYIDPWSKYTGICSTNYTLPVAVVATDGDALDGAIDYSFSVAAWTNAQWVASYFVGENGFTPKPKDFHGQRKAEGETQIALNGYAIQLAEIDVKANALLAANEKLQGLIDELTALDYSTQMGYVTDAAKKEVENYVAACKKNAETVETTLKAAKEYGEKLVNTGVEGLPKITGLSFDLSSIGRAALLAAESALSDALNGQITAQSLKVQKCEEAIEDLEETVASQCSAWMTNADRQKKIAGIKEQTGNVKAALAELEVAYNAANETRMNYAKIVAKGDELQAERERLRIQWAGELSQTRYRNMTYQIFRNDELTRYNEAFELAAKYVFLAARAYDYETGLLQSDSANAAGSEFMTSIVKARALGRFSGDGQPLGGGSEGDPGLADILFRMGENWSVLKTRLGFNNAQGDLDSFSLRKDLFGKDDTSDGDKAWKQALADCWVADLKTHPVFGQYCQPFDPMHAVEPGFAIPFRTTIAARKDLFGNSLAGGSTAYSSTYFATKLRAVGVWIEGANAANALPTRPEVYLVPSGLDYMRVPIRASSSSSVAYRTWQVVDQVLPVPYSLSESDWESGDWSMLKNVFGNELCTQRRHPAIRANVGTSFDADSTMVYNARLVGRSVWNDQWYIFIPAATLHSDDATAKENFLNNVRDIHLNLKTYSLSGN